MTVIAPYCIRCVGLRKQNVRLGEVVDWPMCMTLICLLAGCQFDICSICWPICTLGMLTKCSSMTRLETRTKESNMYASIWVVNPSAQRKWEMRIRNRMQHRPTVLRNGLRRSTHDGTRKMVNFACAGWSQRKLWWRLVEILTCKSFFWRA